MSFITAIETVQLWSYCFMLFYLTGFGFFTLIQYSQLISTDFNIASLNSSDLYWFSMCPSRTATTVWGSRRVQDPLTSRRVCCETPRHPDILHAGCIKGYVLFPCGCSACSQGFSEISTVPWFVPRRVATSSQKALDARAPKRNWKCQLQCLRSEEIYSCFGRLFKYF